MRLVTRLSVFVVALIVASGAAAEEWPPNGYERFVVYHTGTCGVSKSYNGHFEVDCYGQPHTGGTRSGKWRATYDTNCDWPYDTHEVYEVCTSGSSCTATSGTWQEITQAQFDSNYCP